ncbi:tyrosine-type recombinase/integrase [Oenococcus oeni]|uniref:tyrosine-type recombinase/integrase n=1 Tax=Oenococcus oeni TaxID=1247 RepID=UPI000277B91C|nr:site-specific integrase [Oenococcus oeni]EJO02697.1 phage integrase [Oenococcus oeni AWRIB418]OIM24135.1 site-specific integrase [Oenococcus oeni]OIM39032.1 site-specific integrase [Oenococcus oeni]QGR01768.1 site-specific integrase [Oenococcus oeni]TEU23288.1 site-specific integrase [Oenococcus oeni]
MASIKKRGKYYQARVSYRDPVTGEFRTKNKSGFLKTKDAQIWVGQVLSGKQQEKEQPDILLSDYFENWYLTYRVNRSNQTIYQYRDTLHTIKKYLPTMTLKSFTRSNFQTFINNFGKDHAEKTVQKRKGQISAALKDALAEELIIKDPTIRIGLVYNNATKVPIENKYLELNEAEKLIDHCIKNLSRGNFMILTGLLSGARFGELRALTDADIDTKKHLISITKAVDKFTNKDKAPKTKNSIREIIMPDKWFEVYSDFKHNDKRLFDMTSNGINKDLKYLCEKLEIKHITFHALRHTHASMLLAHDISMQYVSGRLGHANLSITEQVYSHLLEEKKNQEEMKAMKIF